MKLTTTITFCFYILSSIAQNKGDFNIEIEANRIHYNNMGGLNRFLKDTTDFVSMYFGDTYINDTLRKSAIYGLSLSYQPLKFVDFGIYGLYQSNQFDREYNQVGLVGDPYSNPEYIIGSYLQKVKSTSFAVGLSTNVYLNKIFRFEDHTSSFLKRFQLAIGLKGGITKNFFEVGNGSTGLQLITASGAENIKGLEYIDYLSFRSMNWSGNTELKLGYRMIDKKLFSTIGLKIGYQFHSTSVLKDKADRPFTFGQEKEEVKLNFSGLYYGIYLNIGK